MSKGASILGDIGSDGGTRNLVNGVVITAEILVLGCHVNVVYHSQSLEMVNEEGVSSRFLMRISAASVIVLFDSFPFDVGRWVQGSMLECRRGHLARKHFSERNKEGLKSMFVVLKNLRARI